jgi:hypothetical protein
MSAPPWLAPYLPSIRDLQELIELSGGFVLVPVEISGPDLAWALADWLADHGHPALVVEPRDDKGWEQIAPSLLALEPARAGVVIVIGGAAPPQGIYAGLRLLNQRRDSIVKRLQCPLLWCGPQGFLNLTWERAPDFWSIRSVDRRLRPEVEERAQTSEDQTDKSLRRLYDEAKKQQDRLSSGQLAVRLSGELISGGDPDEASAVVEESLSLLGTSNEGERKLRAELLLQRARIERLRGESVAAAITLAELVDPETAPPVRVQAHVGLGELLEGTGASARAEREYMRALALARGSGDRQGEALALIHVGRLAARAGRGRDAAIAPIEEALVIATAAGDSALEERARSALSEAFANLHDSPAARSQLESIQRAATVGEGGERSADPALEELREAYQGGNLIVVVGPEISMAAGLPSLRTVAIRLFERARARGVSEDAIGEMVDLVRKDRVYEAIAAAWQALGSTEAAGVVEELLDDHRLPVPEVARTIAGLAPGLRAVLTTNMDSILERAFAGAWPALTSFPGNLAQRRRFILKLHGALLDRSTWFLGQGEKDPSFYSDPNTRAILTPLVLTCPLLFIGFDPLDEDFERLFGWLRALAGSQPPAWYLLAAAQKITQHRLRRLEAAGFRIIAHDNDDGAHKGAVEALTMLAHQDDGAPSKDVLQRSPVFSASTPPSADAPYDPKSYVHRTQEERMALGTLAYPGVPLVFWGPERMGKSTLLRFLLDTVRDQGRVVTVSFAQLEHSALRTIDGLIEALAEQIIRRIVSADDLKNLHLQRRIPWRSRLTELMEDHILTRVDERLVLALEDVDKIIGQPFAGEFMLMLRTWSDRAYERPWSALRLILTVAGSPFRFEEPQHASSPFLNTALLVQLEEFQPEQVVHLAELYGLRWSQELSAKVFPQLGRHPYLLRMLMFAARTGRTDVSGLLDDSGAIGEIFGAHLEHLAGRIENEPALVGAVKAILASSHGSLDAEAYELLYALGIVRRDASGGYGISNGLYMRYFRRRFS